MNGKIVKVSGPIVVAEELDGAGLGDVVRVGEEKLIGEVVKLTAGRAVIQVFEDTRGLGPGMPVTAIGAPLSVALGPGLLGNVYDALQRPLAKKQDPVTAISQTREWEFVPAVAVGDVVTGGSIIGTVAETPAIAHKVMVPPGISGVVEAVRYGFFTARQTVCKLKTDGGQSREITMTQEWPVRVSRPVLRKTAPATPLCTRQRGIDTLFPLVKGGAAAVVGPSGSGKSVLLRKIVQCADVDVVVYIGCGARGSEVAQLLQTLPELLDSKNGEPLIKRTVLISNTADMPTAAREASVYTGVTIAEYFRDMGYDVAVIADSITRWSEALREMSDKLSETPCEDGYPAYLASRLAQFYGRAGCVQCLGDGGRTGTLTALGAVSPPGGDLSEPVTQATARMVKAFWVLDGFLATARKYPAIDREKSWSMYPDTLKSWYDGNFGPEFLANRDRASALLRDERELVNFTGTLSAQSRLKLETAKMIREDFLRQSAFDDRDSCHAYEHQATLLSLILYYFDLCNDALEKDILDPEPLFNIPTRTQISSAKAITELERYRQIARDMELQVEAAIGGQEA